MVRGKACETIIILLKAESVRRGRNPQRGNCGERVRSLQCNDQDGSKIPKNA